MTLKPDRGTADTEAGSLQTGKGAGVISRDIWTAFEQWGWDRRQYARTTQQQYSRRCRAAERWLDPIGLYKASPTDLERWHQSLPSTPSSRNVSRQALLAFYDFLIERTTRTTNPAAILPSYRYPESVPRALDLADAARVVAAPTDPQWAFAMSLLFHSALRATEARTIEWGAIQNGWVTVVVKGGRQRMLPLHRHTQEAAERWRAACPSPRWVFPSPVRNAPLSDSWWRQCIKREAAAAGVSMTPHTARHTAATRMVDLNVNVRYVQEFLGHSQMSSTQRYLRARPVQLAEFVGSLDFAAAA